MARAVSFEINAYGKFARLSAVADYLELLALHGRPVRKAELADAIDDEEIEELIVDPGEPEDERASADAADRAFSLIQERGSLLGDRYPFTLTEDGLLPVDGRDMAESPYVALLAITMTHSYGLGGSPPPHEIFEQTVADVLSHGSVSAVNFSAIRRAAHGFEEAVELAAAQIRLAAPRARALRSKYAQDEKVDVLCHLPWGDLRSGAWTMVGQATCAKSESWDMKAKEPPAPAWARRLGVTPFPWIFLAIPHHAESMVLSKLVQDSHNLVLDRIRLLHHKKDVSGNERDLVQRLFDAQIESI